MSARFLPPEVLQSSTLDCGPATLKALLGGHGIEVEYDHLRRACATDVDGTSIDAVEEVARDSGLDARQAVVPYDHLGLSEARNLPAVAVTKLASGQAHFVLLWRRIGRWWLVMDPAQGRRWMTWKALTEALLPNRVPVDPSVWRRWAATDEFLTPLRARYRRLGLPPARVDACIEEALSEESWRGLARLDAVARCLGSLRDKGVLRTRASRVRAFEVLIDPESEALPRGDWSVVERGSESEQPFLEMRGAVLVRARGLLPDRPDRLMPGAIPRPKRRRRSHAPGLALLQLLTRKGVVGPGSVLMLAIVAAALALIEILLLRGMLGLDALVGTRDERIAAVGFVLLFAIGQALFELPFVAALKRMGRRMEIRLRRDLGEALPRFSDHYLETRLASDIAERCHSIHILRAAPVMLGTLVRSCAALVFTVVALVYWSSATLVPVVVLGAASFAIPLGLQRLLNEHSLRIRTHSGGLMRFYLDAMIGATPIRAHGAQESVRREHESKLTAWGRASLRYILASLTVDGLTAVFGVVSVVSMTWLHLNAGGNPGRLLLLVYWASSIPVLGRTITSTLQQYAPLRSIAIRLFETLDAEKEPPPETPSDTANGTGVELRFEDVVVRVGGRDVLSNIDLHITPGEHVAIVGDSGAGKSTLLGLLLGWHQPASGSLEADGERLEGRRLSQLRESIAWVDPSVQLWNRAVLDNVVYGSVTHGLDDVAEAMTIAELASLSRRLPLGLRTPVGESGAALSGGEGQRLRIARASMRSSPRLAILDEPFRGLDRPQRTELGRRLRTRWSSSTLVCVTHDVSDACAFDRVIVLAEGRVVEDGAPDMLMDRPESIFATLVGQERENSRALWDGPMWRRVVVEDGTVGEECTT